MSLDVALLAGAFLVLVALGMNGPCSGGGADGGDEEAFRAARERMVAEQIAARGVRAPRVLGALREVPRHRFVPEAWRAHAYDDRPLPIGFEQTISQPYIVAVMTEALGPEPGDVVLEVGTGSGYQAAVLSRLVRRVHSIEIVAALAERARSTLGALGIQNVEIVVGDGWQGLPAHAPYDGILVTAAPDRIPEALLDQLAPGGRLVVPVGEAEQDLQVVTRTEHGFETRTLFGVRFVPLVRGDER